LHEAPAAPGIYAWYYEPLIGDFDIDHTIAATKERLAEGDQVGAQREIETLLIERVLSHFRHDSFDIVLSGPLKPRHAGLAEHVQRVSPSLLKRLVENPDRLKALRDLIARSAPYFSSPLYIGTADNLRIRLGDHRKFIEKFRSKEFHSNETDPPSGDEVAGFARRVVSRKISPDQLFVMVCEIAGTDKLHVDAENFLNRLYHPILGRN
jgi:hypothetical protein